MINSDVSIHDFRNFVDGLSVHVGRAWQGVYLENGNCRYRLNDIVKIFSRIHAKTTADDQPTVRQIVHKIRSLEQESFNRAHSTSLIHKILIAFREYIGSFFYNRHVVLNKIEFPNQVLVTSKGPYRLMVLNGEQGTVACRVRGECSATIPRSSKEWVIEGATRSFLRMKNLKTARGEIPGARMMGPCDYFGNVEAPHKYAYTIDIDENGIPAFLINENTSSSVDPTAYTIKPQDVSSTVKATWHKGTHPDTKAIQNKYIHPDKPVLGQSLFPNAGILEIEGSSKLTLKAFDARKIDLAPFKARLVDNKVPFTIISEKIPASDDYRAVTYFYEPNYAEEQVENGGGSFLETHQFAQTMTPIDKTAGGFVTLGRWVDDEKTKLELIAIEIPFGYTLIIDKNCIHGDTTLSGMFMMCMTSNHVTMNTADTVFLKSPKTHANFSLTIDSGSPSAISTSNRPISLSKRATQAEKEKFNEILRRHNVVVNPLQTVKS